MSRRVLLLVGTDHHPFDRAVAWADARQQAHPEETVVIQHGQTEGPAYAAGHAFLPREEMFDLITAATVVITHGGPGTINDARSGGHRPIVLARNPAHGEHVDDHQMRFAAWCGERGLVRLATDLDGLDALVAALGEGGTRESLTQEADPPGVAVVEALAMAPRRTTDRTVLPGSPVVLSVAAAGPDEPLVDALLPVPGAIVVGPAGALPERLADRGTTCACGRAAEACPVWSRVLDEVALDGVDPAPALRTALRRHLPRATRSGLAARAALVGRLVAAAAATTGARMVVDTSDLAGVLTLGHAAGLDVRVVVPPGRGRSGRGAVAAARHRRLPVLTLAGRPGPEVVASRLAALPLPPAGGAVVEHGPDLRLS